MTIIIFGYMYLRLVTRPLSRIRASKLKPHALWFSLHRAISRRHHLYSLDQLALFQCALAARMEAKLWGAD